MDSTRYWAVPKELCSVLIVGIFCTLPLFMVTDDMVVCSFCAPPQLLLFFFIILSCKRTISMIQLKLFFGLEWIIMVMTELQENPLCVSCEYFLCLCHAFPYYRKQIHLTRPWLLFSNRMQSNLCLPCKSVHRPHTCSVKIAAYMHIHKWACFHFICIYLLI